MKRIALYIRVSTEEQAQIKEGSLKSQEQRLREYVNRRSESTPWGKIVAVFIEEGKRGKDTNRPELQKMLIGIKSHLFDLVMVTEFSRLSRSSLDFCNMLELFKEHQCQILSLREQFDTTTAAGEMMMHTMMNFAQFERQQTSERLKANFRSRIKRGLRNGGTAPLGYTFDPDHKGRLKIVDEEVKTVTECFHTFLNEGSLAQAAKSLNQRGFTPKKIRVGGGKYRVGLPHFEAHTLHRILTNPVYIAKRTYEEDGKVHYVDAQWPPLISENIFWEVKKKLLENKDKYKPNSYKRHPYLLSGILTCSICGEALVGKSSYGRNGKYFYYDHGSQIRRNSTTQNPGCHCPLGCVRAIPLEKAIIHRIKELINRPQVVSNFIDQAKKDHKSIYIKEKIDEQKKLIEHHEYKIKILLSHLENEAANKNSVTLYTRLSELENQKKKYEEDLNRLETELLTQIDVIEPQIYLQYLKTILLHLEDASSELQKRLLRSVIYKIVVKKEEIEAYYYTEKDTVERQLDILQRDSSAAGQAPSPQRDRSWPQDDQLKKKDRKSVV